MRKATLVIATVLVQALFCGCGTENRSDFDFQKGVLRISPAAASVHVGASVQFKAMMDSDWVQDVRWSVSGNCTEAECGTVESNGIYTAPSESPGKVFLSATLATDASKSATAEIIVSMSSTTFTISPPTATVVVGETQTFEVTNCIVAADLTCAFKLSAMGCSGDSCGSLSRTLGTSTDYTAPGEVPDPPTVFLTAFDLLRSKTAVITIVGNGNTAAAATHNFLNQKVDSVNQRGSSTYLSLAFNPKSRSSRQLITATGLASSLPS